MRSATIDDVYELSPLQRGILLHSTHDGSTDMYLSQHTYAVDGPLDTAVLVRSWEATTAAHPVLRTSFHWRDLDKPLQVVHREVHLPVRHLDWSGKDERDQHELLGRLQTEDRATGIDPENPPLQRLAVIRLGEHRHRILWTYHHVLLDGWSIPLVLDEVMAWYRSIAGGVPEPRPVPAYREYIGWLQRQDDTEARTFWTETLAGVSPTRVAPDEAKGGTTGTGTVQRRIVPIPAATSSRLRDAAAGHRVTPSTLLQAVWAVVLQQLTGGPEIVFGSATSGRPADLPGVDRMVGLLANTLPLRVTVPRDGDLGTWLRSLQNHYAAMRRYEFTPLSEIKRCAGLPGRQLFDSLLVMENYSLAVDAHGVGDPGDTGSDDADSGIDQAVSLRVETLYDKIDLPLTLTVAPSPVSEIQLLIHEARFATGFADELLDRLFRTLEAAVTSDDVAAVVTAAGPPNARAAMAEPAARTRPAGPAAPSTPREIAVAAAFEEVLGVPVDAVTSFFELGGDSFDAVRAVGRLDGAGVALLAAHPTVRELAAALDLADGPDGAVGSDGLDDEIADLERALEAKRAAKRAAREDRTGRTSVSREGLLPCSRQQEGLWFMYRLDPLSPVYNVPFGMRLHGALDVAALRRAVLALVVRHEPLRTRFTDLGGAVRQRIDAPPEEVAVPVVEIAATDVDAWAAEQARLPFDLENGPVFRASLAEVAADEHVLVLVVHHIVADGWSALVLARELSLIYTGSAERLPPLTLQAVDLAVEQAAHLHGPELERQLGYWREHLAGLTTVDMPTDRPRPAQPTGSGGATRRRLPEATATAANRYSRENGVSFLAVLQAGLLTVLHHYTGQTDLTIGSIFSGRTRPETEPLVGYLANTLVLRTHLNDNPTFTQLTHQCHHTVLAATERQDLPFSLLVDDLQPHRIPGRNPLFQISLTLQPADLRADLALGDVVAEPLAAANRSARFDLAIDVADAPDGLGVSAEYSTDLFDRWRIERLLDDFTHALRVGTAAPSTIATALPFDTGPDRAEMPHVRPAAAGPDADHVPIVTLKAGGERPPLILVHAAGGSILPYVRLVSLLDEDRPVRAIEDPGMSGGPRHDGLDERAARYAAAIRRAVPDGVCCLGGWSFGGVVAVEMAGLLHEAGVEVEKVVALDSRFGADARIPEGPAALADFVHDLAGLAGAPAPHIDLDSLRGLDRRTVQRRVLDALAAAGLVPDGLRDEVALRMTVFAANLEALRAHRPRAGRTRLLLLSAGADRSPRLSAWDGAVGELVHRQVPGTHYSMLDHPHITAVAAAVREWLA
ncbi:condensation domain-containing protein [Pseudonocardia sp. ICBG1142]|uniref:condensation domain-containing protein n=1 Tax=Pseudonocardia sp. ICBG1142 TaxID=2846760 RepID=UPI001CF6120C|nr:condensation domain-containing protein [Pseudonocardia sp. ICBG1142]